MSALNLRSLVSAMSQLSLQLNSTSSEVNEVELGSLQVAIKRQDHFIYTAVKDIYDNRPFTDQILNQAIDFIHHKVVESRHIPTIEEQREVGLMLKTMRFPIQLLPKLETYISEFNANTGSKFDVLFLADLDEGIIKIYNGDRQQNIINLLLEVLSELPFEKIWIAHATLADSSEEELCIYRVGLTDYVLMGRAMYTSGDAELHLRHFSVLADSIQRELFDYTQ